MSIARDSAVDLASQVAVMALSLIAGVFVSRLLGAEGRGTYVLATSVANTLLFSLTNIGLQHSCQVLVAKDRTRLAELHTTAAVLCVGVGVTVAGVIAIAGEWMRRVALAGIDPAALWLVAAALPFLLYQAAWRGLMNGVRAVRQRALADLALGVAQSLAVLAILFTLNAPVRALIVAYYAIAIVGTLALIAMLARQGRIWCAWRGASAREMLAFGAWVHVGNLASRMRALIDQLIVNAMGGGTALGIYNQAASLAGRATAIGGALDSASYQPITAAESGEAGRLVASAFRQMLLLGFVAGIVGWFAAPLIPLIYGAEFREAVMPFRILLPAVCFGGCGRMIAIYFSGHLARPRIAAGINWITVTVQIGASIFLAKSWGLLAGITAGSAIGYAATTLLFVAMFLARPETPRWPELVRIRAEDFSAWKRLVLRLVPANRRS